MRLRYRLSPLLLVAVLAGCAAVPPQPSPPAEDAELLTLVRPSFTDAHDRAAVAIITDSGVRTAFIRADAGTHFEIGSVTKVFTGQLLAEAISRGEVTLDDHLGQHLDLGDSAAASVTLRQLATHRSGLPTFPDDPEWQTRVLALMEQGADPFDESLEEVLALAGANAVKPDAGFEYSNMGAALLGNALAAAAGTTYPELLAERIFEPLGLEDAVVPFDDGDEPATHAGGFQPDGSPASVSTLAAWSPAGGIHATLDDLIAFAQAVIDGPLSNSPALEPLVMHDGEGHGYLWSVHETPSRVVVSHEGLTAGFWAHLSIDRTAGAAVIILSNDADGAGAAVGPLLSLARG